jgi:hypothetical protein
LFTISKICQWTVKKYIFSDKFQPLQLKTKLGHFRAIKNCAVIAALFYLEYCIILPSWLVKKGFNNRRRNKRTGNGGTKDRNSGIGSQKRDNVRVDRVRGQRKEGGKQGTESWGKRTGDKEQRRKIGDRGRETGNRDVRLGKEDWRQGTEA